MKKTLRNKETKEILTTIKEAYGIDDFSKKDKFEINDNIIIINNDACFFYYEKKLIPVLKILLKKNPIKKVTVDMGAVPFIVKGADLMRPGITKLDDDITKNEIVTIVDETHGKCLAVGVTIFSGSEILEMKSGKVIKIIHYVGDELWNYH